MKITFFVCILALVSGLGGCRILNQGGSGGNSMYASFGDCVAWGALATPRDTNTFAELTAAFLNRLYPRTTLLNCGMIQANSENYLGLLTPLFPKIAELSKGYGPLARASLLLGTDDLQKNNDPNVDQVKASMVYKARLQGIIDAILKLNPTCQLVLCTNFDQNNGGMGTMRAYPCPGLIKEFNKRIFELGKENHLPVADLYTAMMGHPEDYVPTDTHPNTQGHAAIASVLEGIFDTGPGAHAPKPGDTPTPFLRFDTFYLGTEKRPN